MHEIKCTHWKGKYIIFATWINECCWSIVITSSTVLIQFQEEGSTITKVCSMSWVFSDVIMEKALKYDQGIGNPVSTE